MNGSSHRPVLVVSNEFMPIHGGIATYSYELARAFHERRRSVLVLAAQRTECDREFDTHQPFPILRMPQPRLSLARHVARLAAVWRVIARQKPCAIIAVDWRIGIWPSLLTMLYRTPCLVTAHGSEVLLASHGLLKKRLARLVYAQAFRVMADSAYARGLLIALGVPADHISVVLLGARSASNQNEPTDSLEFKTKWGLVDRRVLLTVARLVRRKGHDIVLRALLPLVAEYPDVLYVIVGDGETRIELEQSAARLGLLSNVLFTGSVSNAERDQFLETCDIYVQPSRREGDTVEGFGLSLADAMARGKVVIATKHGGIEDIVTDRYTGLLVDEDDPDTLARTVLSVLQAPDQAKQLGVNARRIVIEQLNWQRVITDIDKILSTYLRPSTEREAP